MQPCMPLLVHGVSSAFDRAVVAARRAGWGAGVRGHPHSGGRTALTRVHTLWQAPLGVQRCHALPAACDNESRAVAASVLERRVASVVRCSCPCCVVHVGLRVCACMSAPDGTSAPLRAPPAIAFVQPCTRDPVRSTPCGVARPHVARRDCRVAATWPTRLRRRPPQTTGTRAPRAPCAYLGLPRSPLKKPPRTRGEKNTQEPPRGEPRGTTTPLHVLYTPHPHSLVLPVLWPSEPTNVWERMGTDSAMAICRMPGGQLDGPRSCSMAHSDMKP